jgi:hypothetical protein
MLFGTSTSPVQDCMQDYYTSRTAAIESCSCPTPPSYICHQKSTLGPPPLASDEVCACLSQTIKCINVELIIRNYNRNNISNVLIRLFETIAITCQIYKWKKENYLLAVVSVALSQRSFPHAQQLHDVCCSLALWQCDTPKFSDLGSSCLLCCSASHANLFSSSTLFHYWHCSSRYTGSFNCFTLMTHQARSSCLDSKDLKSK